MKTLILILLGLAYLLNYCVLLWLYPDVSNSQEEYYKFISSRNIVYEGMFFMFFVLVFLLSEGFMKSVACFFVIMTAGSLIDKAVFHMTEYLISDIILAIIAIAISVYVYFFRKAP